MIRMTHALEIRRSSLRVPGMPPVIEGFDLALAEGEIGCLLGPSGCGKTTALRCIAGLEPAHAGEIRLRGRGREPPGVQVPTEERRVGVVFQDYALFPAPRCHGQRGLRPAVDLPRAERRKRAAELLATVGLPGSGTKFPHELSGGQKQRVALARALAPRPLVLLLDEPFSNLDGDLRERLSIEVRGILKAQGTTALLVTHDQNEAFAMADTVGVMRKGRIEQWDTAYNLYHRPISRFVANFVGEGVLIDGLASDSDGIDTVLGALKHCPGCDLKPGMAVALLLRPDDVQHDDDAILKAEVVKKAFRGAEFLYTLKLEDGKQLLSLVPSHHNHAIGEKIGIKLDVDHVVAFPRAEGADD